MFDGVRDRLIRRIVSTKTKNSIRHIMKIHYCESSHLTSKGKNDLILYYNKNKSIPISTISNYLFSSL